MNEPAGEWFRNWFDEDYTTLYAHRDQAEAARAVQTLLRTAPGLASGPVLDLGCGTGRHLLELRKTNPQAFGLDLSAHLLRLAPPELRGHLLRGDMRHLPVQKQSLAGICMWFTPFGYFSDAENGQLVSDLAARLKPGGILVLDFLNAERLKRELVPEDTVERGGLRAHSRRSIEAGRVVKRMRIEQLATGAIREVTESVRIYTPVELQELATTAGLKLSQAFGDYTGAAYNSAVSPRWIGLFSL